MGEAPFDTFSPMRVMETSLLDFVSHSVFPEPVLFGAASHSATLRVIPTTGTDGA
jgi:hypothetical protein